MGLETVFEVKRIANTPQSERPKVNIAVSSPTHDDVCLLNDLQLTDYKEHYFNNEIKKVEFVFTSGSEEYDFVFDTGKKEEEVEIEEHIVFFEAKWKKIERQKLMRKVSSGF